MARGILPVSLPPSIPAKVDALNAGIREHLINLEDLRLWEIRYTGPTPLLSEVSPSFASPLTSSLLTLLMHMLNPAPRASIVSALFQPQSFHPASGDYAMPQQLPMWKLPDASILFCRYLETGCMINVYDWYDSFSQAIKSLGVTCPGIEVRAQAQICPLR